MTALGVRRCGAWLVVATMLVGPSGEARGPLTFCGQQLLSDGRASGSGPLIFVLHKSAMVPVRGVAFRGQLAGELKITLDDGGTGTVTVRQEGCTSTEPCPPADCGCLANDSHWIEVTGPDGQMIARIHLWAAYSAFDIIPIDLVDGPGDELLIIRILGRSSPPNGHTLKAVKIGADGGVDLLPSYTIAGNLPSIPMSCGRWRARLVIADEPKPRSIAVSREVVLEEGCGLEDPAEADAIRQHTEVLRLFGK